MPIHATPFLNLFGSATPLVIANVLQQIPLNRIAAARPEWEALHSQMAAEGWDNSETAGKHRERLHAETTQICSLLKNPVWETTRLQLSVLKFAEYVWRLCETERQELLAIVAHNASVQLCYRQLAPDDTTDPSIPIPAAQIVHAGLVTLVEERDSDIFSTASLQIHPELDFSDQLELLKKMKSADEMRQAIETEAARLPANGWQRFFQDGLWRIAHKGEPNPIKWFEEAHQRFLEGLSDPSRQTQCFLEAADLLDRYASADHYDSIPIEIILSLRWRAVSALPYAGRKEWLKALAKNEMTLAQFFRVKAGNLEKGARLYLDATTHLEEAAQKEPELKKEAEAAFRRARELVRSLTYSS